MAIARSSRLNHPEEYRLFLKLMKTFADLKETRGRRVTEQSFVQNMTVKDGGQAIVDQLSAYPSTAACRNSN